MVHMGIATFSDKAMMVAVTLVDVVEMPIHKVISMAIMGHHFVSARVRMLVVGFMCIANVSSGARGIVMGKSVFI